MSNNESPFDSEPNASDGESYDDQRDTDSEALSFDSADSEDAEVEVIGERVKVVPSVSRGKVLPMDKAVPLVAVPCGDDSTSTSQYYEFLMRDTWVPDRHASFHSETSTFGRGDVAAESSSWPLVTIVQQGNPRVPLGQPTEFCSASIV